MFAQGTLCWIVVLFLTAITGAMGGYIWCRRRCELKHPAYVLKPAVEHPLTSQRELVCLVKAMQMSGDSLLILDMENKIIAVNRAMARTYGAESPNELVGRHFLDLLAPQEWERVEGEREELLHKGYLKDREYFIVTGDGRRLLLETSMALVRDANGHPVGIIGISRDMTERRRAEREREQLLAQFRERAWQIQQIVDTVPEGVILLDREHRVMLANPLGRRDLATLAQAEVGDTLTQLGGRPLAELLTSPPRGLWHELTAEQRHFQLLARPIEDGATPQGWVIVIRDVTRQREIERRIQQQERLAAVGQLAAGIAHDFNNIMATIVLYAQMTAREQTIPARVRERMSVINQQAHYAGQLIQQILDFSRRTVLERQPMDLRSFLKEQVKLLRRTFPESIEVNLTCDPGDYTIHADPARIQQVVMNLALNARDAMPDGGRLCISLSRLTIAEDKHTPLPDMQAGEWICLRVSDTGCGIPPDVLPHIFEPFFTTKPAGEGTGLGLAQVWGIVQQHQGHIDVSTKVGQGTTFTVYLPAMSNESVTTEQVELQTLPQGHGETILVVEDNQALRTSLQQSLEMLHYRVLTAAHGREGLRRFEQHNEIALILTDDVMPEMGGRAMLRALRERGWQGPAVIITGHPLQSTTDIFPVGCAVQWMQKPVTLEQLAYTVADALGVAENERRDQSDNTEMR